MVLRTTKPFCAVLTASILASCNTTDKSADSALYGSALTAAASYLSYSQIKELYQNSGAVTLKPEAVTSPR